MGAAQDANGMLAEAIRQAVQIGLSAKMEPEVIAEMVVDTVLLPDRPMMRLGWLIHDGRVRELLRATPLDSLGGSHTRIEVYTRFYEGD